MKINNGYLWASLLGCLALALAQVVTPLPGHVAPKVDHSRGRVDGERHRPILPWTGLYSDPEQSGSGLSVDMGLEGMMFMTFGTFDSQGRQENLLAQPLYKPTSNRERHDTGVIGRATAEFFRVRNGQTPGGAWREPDYEATGLVAEFEWTAPRRVTMRFGGHTYNWQGNNYDGRTDGAFLEGTWAITRVSDEAPWYNPHSGGPPIFRAYPGIVNIQRWDVPLESINPPPSSRFDPERHFPKEGDELYLITCAPAWGGQYQSKGQCVLAATPLVNTVGEEPKGLIWYNPESGKGGLASLESGRGSRTMYGTSNADLYIRPDTIHIRPGRFSSGYQKPDILSNGLTLARLPDGVKVWDFDPDQEGGCTNCD